MSPAFKNIQSALHRTAHVKEQKQKKTACKQKTLVRMLSLTIMLIGVLYLIQINVLATRGYVIKDLEKQIAAVTKENNGSNMKVLQAQGLGALQAKIDTLGLVRSDHIQYIGGKDTGLAAR